MENLLSYQIICFQCWVLLFREVKLNSLLKILLSSPSLVFTSNTEPVVFTLLHSSPSCVWKECSCSDGMKPVLQPRHYMKVWALWCDKWGVGAPQYESQLRPPAKGNETIFFNSSINCFTNSSLWIAMVNSTSLIGSFQRRQFSKKKEHTSIDISRDFELHAALASCISVYCAFHESQKAQAQYSIKVGHFWELINSTIEGKEKKNASLFVHLS